MTGSHDLNVDEPSTSSIDTSLVPGSNKGSCVKSPWLTRDYKRVVEELIISATRKPITSTSTLA